MNTLLRLIVTLTVCVGLVWCQSGAFEWGRVETTKTGHRIRVETRDKKHDGAFLSASGTDVNLTTRDGAQVTVPRGDVRRVYVQSKSHRIRNTIIGTAAGLAVGIAVYASLGALFRNEGHDNTEAMIIVPTAAGAAIGAVLPTGRMEKLYDADQP